MKKKYFIAFILLFSILFILSGCDKSNQNNTNNESADNIQVNRTNAELNNTNTVNNSNTSNNTNTVNNSNTSNNTNINESNNNSINTNSTNEIASNPETNQVNSEMELANFSTPIIDKRENRQNNLRITCSKLNNLTVNSGESFSFLQTIGKSTAEEGYKEADILVDGKTEQALGGGNCQVSTTLYNAVLNSEGLAVTEHHDHGKKVPYIEEGKDATIAFPSLDLKFKNNLPNQIKIYASTDGNNVTVKIVKIS